MLATTLLALVPAQDLSIWEVVDPIPPGYAAPYTASVAADFDGDGHQDLLFAMERSRTLDLHLGGPSGDFEETRIAAAGLDLVEEILARDIDGDGDVDFATVSRYSQLVTFHANDGDGNFAPRVVVDVSVSQGSGLDAADLDGDGDLDLVAAHRGSGLVAWNAQVAPGQFGPRQVIAQGLGAVLDVVAGDTNGDGVVDVVYSNGASEVGVLNGLGGGSFAAPTVLGITPAPLTRLVFGDLDGDGDMDLVGPSPAGVQRFTRGAALALDTPVTPAAWDVQDLALRDMDLDGDDDVVVGHYVFSLEASGAFTSDAFTFDVPWLDASIDNALAADLDGDGRPDLVLQGNRFDQTVPFELNPRPLLYDAAPPGQTFGVGDFDLDGDIDVYVPRVTGSFGGADASDLDVWLNDGQGSFDERLRVEDVFPGLGGGLTLVLDFDGDGIQDLVQQRFGATRRCALGTGSGFGVPFDVPYTIDPHAPLADGDADGDLDLFERDPGTGDLMFTENLGAGTFAAPVLALANTGRPVDFADVNRDGALDLLLAIASSPTTSIDRLGVALGNPAAPGRFVSVTPLTPPFGGIQDGAFADLDGDGWLDVDTAQGSFGTSVRDVYFGDGTGSFGPSVSVGQPPLYVFNAVYADFDGDGALDIVARTWVSSNLRRLAVAHGDGSGAFGAPDLGPYTSFATWIETADLDGDGDDDVVLLGSNGIVTVESRTDVGAPVCAGTVNSTGAAADLRIGGSPKAPTPLDPQGSCTLNVTGAPVGQTVLFVGGTAAANVPGAGGSQGTLCLGGALSRYTRPGEVQFADAAGRARLPLDLGATPVGNVIQAVTAGQTLYFQAWYRDVNPGPTSNFTSAVSVTFL